MYRFLLVSPISKNKTSTDELTKRGVNMKHYEIPCEGGNLIVFICRECGRVLGIEGEFKEDIISYCPHCHHKFDEHIHVMHQF